MATPTCARCGKAQSPGCSDCDHGHGFFDLYIRTEEGAA
jgi:hypothetical protein